ncbi:MAG: Smr/MutS family protein [Neomegalonema sp.]|nr:Smr/MutS family protein [Neomegalonema sp.]
MSGRRRRGLTPEEKALWDQIARQTTPLQRKAAEKRERHAQELRAEETTPHLRDSAPLDPHPIPDHKSHRSAVVKPTPPSSMPRVNVQRAAPLISDLRPGAPGLDRRTARALRRGKREPDARVDLHGMSAERAQVVLRNFILSEFNRDSRCVLVITGKGGRSNRDAFADMRSFGEGRGVLRTLTPEWLRSPPLSQFVTDVYQAHQSHGGGGALYVYLRKNR